MLMRYRKIHWLTIRYCQHANNWNTSNVLTIKEKKEILGNSIVSAMLVSYCSNNIRYQRYLKYYVVLRLVKPIADKILQTLLLIIWNFYICQYVVFLSFLYARKGILCYTPWRPSVCLSVCPSVRPYVRPSVRPSVR
jgi:hypothetical protein